MAHPTTTPLRKGAAPWLLWLLLAIWTGSASAFGLAQIGRPFQLAPQLLASSASANGSDADSLTLEELAARLRQARSQTRSQFSDPSSPEAISAQLAFCDQLLSTRFRNLALSRSQPGPSNVHGTGLFATRPIQAEELITLYPGDALLAWGDEYGGKPGPEGCPLQAMYGPHISGLEQAAPEFFLLRPHARDFEVVTGKRRSIVGDPSRNTDPAYLGHLANDAACLDGTNNSAYETASSEGANAAHLCLEGCHFVTIATRDVQEGQEILVSYGEGYWKGRSSANNGGSGPTKKKKIKSNSKASRGFGKS